MKQFIFLLLCSTLCAFDPIIVVLGPPGSGKGNFSQLFKEQYGYLHLDAGGIIRREINQETPRGLLIAESVKKGEYVDTQIMHSLMIESIQELSDQNKPFLIDGFGGQENDIQFLYETLNHFHLTDRTFVVFLDADDAICKRRMSGRLLCSSCERIYNTNTLPPKVDNQCDECLVTLVQRLNDTPELIEKRIAFYRAVVDPNYKKSLKLFPSLFIRTDSNLEACSQLFHVLADKIVQFEGNANQFIEESFLKTHIMF